MDFNMNDFSEIIKFAEGKMTFDEFELLTNTNSDTWYLLQSLISQEMKENVNHPIWSDKGLRMILEANRFSVRASVESFGIDNDFGKSRLHHIISNLISYHFPEVKIRVPKEQSDSDLLEQIKMDYIAGPEVDKIIEEIIFTIPREVSKKEYRLLLKNALKDTFHIKRNHPDWVQEPEWPIGKDSPMEYVSTTACGDLVRFTFRDVDTGEERIVEQLY